jgi:FtsZ-binding cell division protein ZapB
MSDKVSAEAPAPDIVKRLRSAIAPMALDREAADTITALRAEVERLTAVNALMEYAAFPSAEDAKEAETWIAANPGRPLSDYCPPGGLLVKRLTAENERLREELDTWKSVFPDIAPASVLPDRSLLEADNARLRRALKWYEEQTRLIRGTPDEVEKAYPTLASDGGKIARTALKEPRI